MSITVEGATGRIHTEALSSQHAEALGYPAAGETNFQ